jgi:hypothetical protein
MLHNLTMVKRLHIAVLMSLSLIMVSFASISFAADGGSGHEEHPQTMAADSHHEMASNGGMMDCPAHHDGHTMKNAQCAVACFTMISAVNWHGMTFIPLTVMPNDSIAFADQFYATRTLHIPTPPPNFV